MKTKPKKKRRKKSKHNHKKQNKTITKNKYGLFRHLLSKNSILAIVTILSFVFGIIQWHQNAKSSKENKKLIASNKKLVEENISLTTGNKALIERNTKLLENIVTNKYEIDLQKKYPSGYVLFGVDRSRKFENRSIPHRSNLLEEYEFDWNRVRVSDVTKNIVTIEMPNIHFKPLNTQINGIAMSIPRIPKGKEYRYPLRPEGTKNRIFVELVEDSDSLFIFAIGFKSE